MPRNARSRRCSVTGCRAYATRDSDPPTCASHAGRNIGAGAPPGNQNRRTHGHYSKTLDEEELAELAVLADDPTIDDEIAILRIALRRCMIRLTDDQEPLTNDQWFTAIGLIITSARAIAALLRDRRALTGQAADGAASVFSQIIDEITTELGLCATESDA